MVDIQHIERGTGLITLLFRVRDRLLAWQKGLVQW